MHQQDAKDLLLKYAKGECTPQEAALVEQWFLQVDPDAENISHEEVLDAMEHVRSKLPGQPGRVRRIGARVAVAASVLLLLGIGSTYFLKRPVASGSATYKVGQDVPPAQDQATLTLADGRKIPLSRLSRGQLVRQGAMLVRVTPDSVLSYAGTGGIGFNTLSTARGERAPYPLVLSDGTKVWLDAASSIRFPVAFGGDYREVSITGQAYFEVRHKATQPFRVMAGDQLIEDIGTSFNVTAFADEPNMRTSLLEGSIRVSRQGHSQMLTPGQQVIFSPHSANLKVQAADTEEAIAWKANYFYFNHEDLHSVLRKISRWYNVDVEYPAGKPIEANYWGTLSRESNLSLVLNRLEATSEVRFTIAGNKIIVSKK